MDLQQVPNLYSCKIFLPSINLISNLNCQHLTSFAACRLIKLAKILHDNFSIFKNLLNKY